MIICYNDAEKTDSSVQEQRERFIELVGLENYEIVIDPEKCVEA